MDTSQRITSGNSRLATATPARPFAAESGLKTSLSSMRTRFSHISASSSITRIFFIEGVRGGLGLKRVGEQRQTHRERRPLTLDALKLDFATMQGHAALDNEQA